MSKKKEKEAHYVTFRYSCGHERETKIDASFEGETIEINRPCDKCMKAKILERITERTINELAPVIAERLQARTEIKGEIALNHDEFCALYAAIEQLLYYKDDKPNPSSGYVQMACSLSQEEIKSLVNIFERLKQM